MPWTGATTCSARRCSKMGIASSTQRIGFRVWGSGFRVDRVWGLGFSVKGLEFRVQGFGFQV